MRPYEVVYIFDASLDQEAVEAKLATFQKKLGGSVTATDQWGTRQLAYPIGKTNTAYYVVMHVEADPASLPEFERLLKLDEEVLRYLVVLDEGQPTSGESILAERPPKPRSEEDDEDEDEEEDDDDDEDDDEDDEGSGPSGPPEFSGARGRRRRHEGPAIELLNYKDVTSLARFLTEEGKILPKRTTKVTARFQRQLGTAVKRARFLALLPYIRDHEA
ncbi:MAG: 30S ribosomal protein S18 [Gemmatimonadetes bacterium]|nr:30S ribosomal protein S18 [Gemmatimonadota bacterium]